MDPREIFGELEEREDVPRSHRTILFSLCVGGIGFAGLIFYLATTNAMTFFVVAGSETLHRVLGIGSAAPVAEVALHNTNAFLPAPEKNVLEDGSVPLSSSTLHANFTDATTKEASGAVQKKVASAPSPKDGASAAVSPSHATPPSQKVSTCDFSSGENPSHEIVLNEIAWMGSVPKNGETSAHASAREWIELKNTTAHDVAFSNWQLLDATNKVKIFFSAGDHILAHGLFLLERKDDSAVGDAAADKIYSGSLPNDGAWLRLFDSSCVPVDEVNGTRGWSGGNNTTKTTLERNSDGIDWHTSAVPGGTPRKENSGN